MFYKDDNEPVSANRINEIIPAVLRKAGMKPNRKVHILRHTFCSHLAMRAAPAKAIQELAGHTDLTTTMRYMHLAPGSLRAAVDLLENRPGRCDEENMAETAAPNTATPQ